MIGAAPHTDWLREAIDLDAKGFVVTGRGGDPFATSKLAVFAVGDIRAGSVERVASAVGEGSVAVSSVHGFLAGRGQCLGLKSSARASCGPWAAPASARARP